LTSAALPVSFVRSIVRIRVGQQMINERYKAGAFKVPIHLALGHEAVAAGVHEAMQQEDQLVLSHRNVHYHLARSASLRDEVDEYLLVPDGMGQGRLGSMNLACDAHGIPYASCILGNNLPVATGLALAQCRTGRNGVVFVVTGDGAMEEGAFYESLVLMKSLSLPVVIVVENNDWSLGTRVAERRCPIDLGALTSAVGVHFVRLSGADPRQCRGQFPAARQAALERRAPVVVEAALTTLGHWLIVDDRHPQGRFVNYHAGPAKTVAMDTGAVVSQADDDPVFVLQQIVGDACIRDEAAAARAAFEGEWA
jgi:TPP-dependent pyruvate/acetoin dehydrogenase alpha subunit